MTKFAFSRKRMAMLVLLEDLKKKKNIKVWKNGSNLYFQLFKGFFTNVSKNDLGGLDKIVIEI